MKNAVFWGVMQCGSCKNSEDSHGVTSQKTKFFSKDYEFTTNLGKRLPAADIISYSFYIR
jgi:hypothetical protein